MSTSAPSPTATPSAYASLVDDAHLLESPGAAVADAVRRFVRVRAGQSPLVGSLVVEDHLLPELSAAAGGQELSVAVLLTGGAGAVEPAVRWAERCSEVRLTALVAGLRDLDDLAGAARRTVRAAEAAGDVPLHVAVPLSEVDRPGWASALDELAAAEVPLQLDLRRPVATGTLAAVLDAALDRELPVTIRAGASDLVGEGELPGVLTVLLAVRTALDGGDVVAALEERSPAATRARLVEVGDEAVTRARRWFLAGSVPDPSVAARSLRAVLVD